MVLPLSDFLLVWSIVALNTTTPGPNVVNTIATAMSAGRRAGLGAASGVALGVVGWCLGFSLGFATIFATFPALQAWMAIVAAALLGWLALRSLLSAWRGFHGARRGMPQILTQVSFARALSRAVMISASNPKVLTTWLSIVTLFPVAKAGAGDIALLTAGSSLIALGFHSIYAALFSTQPAVRFYLRAGWVISAVAGVFFAFLSANLFLRLISG